MIKDTRNALTGFLIAACAVAFLSFFANAQQPSKEDYALLDQVKANQKILSKNRKAFDAFSAAKQSNAAAVPQLGKHGWCVKWDTLTLVQCFQ